MPFHPDLSAELKVLTMFNLDTVQAGIKVHKDAEVSTKAAVERLFDKGLITQPDGGYLTELGRSCAEHLQHAVRILQNA
ncbi:MAG TPA: TIGR02647 family protein [Rheinheimera sp.]|nr:TIGR02647 family protein [Rheinheimera sp.]